MKDNKSEPSSKATELIDNKELSKRLGVSLVTLRKWRNNREIPFIKIGRIYRYDWEQIVKSKTKKTRI